MQGPLIPELAELLPEADALRVQRAGIVNTWNDQQFTASAERTRPKHVIMAGVTTDACLLFPAISAAQARYAVQAVIDVSGSPSER